MRRQVGLRNNPSGRMMCGYGDAGSGKTGRRESSDYYREAYYMATAISLSASAGAGTVGLYSDTNLRIDSDADFEVQKIIFAATSPSIKARIRNSLGEYMIPNNTDLQGFGGTQFNSVGPGAAVNWFTPYILSWPFRFPASSDITIEAADYSGAGNTLYLALWGAKIFCGKPIWKDPIYELGQPLIRSTDRQTVTANGTRVLTMNMDSDADFMITKASAVRTAAALVSVHEDARGRDWGNRATHIDNIFGSGQFAHKLSAPRFLPRNSTLSINVQDLSGSNNVVEVIIEGIKYHTKG